MKRNLFIITVLFLIFFYSSCETDFDIDAEWKEITVVYGLFDQRDTVHYIRINKAFLGGNALEIAKIEDSSSYKNNLEVVMEGWDGNTVQQTIIFDTTTISNKDTGDFYNPYMVVYKGEAQLNEDYEYKLFIKNTKSGNDSISSSTKLVHDFSILKPNSGSKASFTSENPKPFKWYSAKNGRRYEPVIRFHYYEVPYDKSDTIPKYLDWYLSIQMSATILGSEEMDVYYGNTFFSIVENNLDKNFVGIRLAGKVDFIISVAGDEYNTYMEVNAPTSSIVQERPEYTNIENGIGLLSSRYQKLRSLDLSPQSEYELISMDLEFVSWY